MDARERNLRIDYWYKEGIKIFTRWLKTRDEHVLGAFECCAACIVEFDKKHKDKRTQDLQEKAWFLGYLRGETSLEKLKNSGYYSEERLEKFAAALD